MSNSNQRSFLERFIKDEINDLFSLDLYRACAAEFLGVLILNFLGIAIGYCSNGSITAIAVGVGFFVGCEIRIFSKVSGGHINPAISLGFALVRTISIVRLVFYSVVQTFGAAAGTFFLKALLPAQNVTDNFGIILPAPGVSDMQALVCEIFITFFLLFGVFALLDLGKDDPVGFIPFQIGLIVSANVFAAVCRL